MKCGQDTSLVLHFYLNVSFVNLTHHTVFRGTSVGVGWGTEETLTGMWRTGRPAAVLIFLSVTFVVLLYQENLSNTAEKIRYIVSYIIDLKNSYFVSDYEEWLHNQNELKSRIWRTCRKYKLAVTRKYQTHPRHFIKTAGSFVYCANHKVNHRNHRISLK